MLRPAHAKLLNSRGRVTKHVFKYVRVEDHALYPIFRCEETEDERVFGYLPPELGKRELELWFGPLDEHLRSAPARALFALRAA